MPPGTDVGGVPELNRITAAGNDQMKRRWSSSGKLPSDPARGRGGLRSFDRFYWDDTLPVPPHLHLPCEGCGRDIAGAPRRVCPDCGRKIHLPLPEELNLRCPQCDYALTGLTTRICPECGTGFDLRTLLRQKRWRQFAERLARSERPNWATAILLGSFGLLLLLERTGPIVCLLFLLVPTIVAAVLLKWIEYIGYDPLPAERSQIALRVGALWAIIGVMAWILS
jgi:hypothetical protein